MLCEPKHIYASRVDLSTSLMIICVFVGHFSFLIVDADLCEEVLFLSLVGIVYIFVHCNRLTHFHDLA